MTSVGTSLVVQWLSFRAPNAGGLAFKTLHDLTPVYFFSLILTFPALPVLPPSVLFYVCLSSCLHKYKPSLQVTSGTKSFASSQPEIPSSSSEYPQQVLCLSSVQMILFYYVDNFQSPAKHLSCVLYLFILFHLEHLHPSVLWAPHIPFLNQTHYLLSRSLFSSYDPPILINGTTTHPVSRQRSFLLLLPHRPFILNSLKSRALSDSALHPQMPRIVPQTQ